MKIVIKCVLLAMAIVSPPGVAHAKATTPEVVKICSLSRVWVPPGESDKGYPYLGYWMRVKICEPSDNSPSLEPLTPDIEKEENKKGKAKSKLR